MNIGLYFEHLEPSYTDIFSESDFKEICTEKLFVYPVISKDKDTYFAACLLTVDENKALLDYRPFPKLNSEEGILLGRLKLQLKREDEFKILKAFWSICSDGKDGKFEEILFERTTPEHKQPVPVPKRIFESLQYEEFFDDKECNSSLPKKISVATSSFLRNRKVAKEALAKANGICQECGKKAPFTNKHTGQPYLEVHHIQQLSAGGKDSPDNIEALCPNCHREKHFGKDVD